MSVQLLDKTRKINKLLHNNNSHKVVFNDICKVLSEILLSNILVISKKGKVLGVSIWPGVDEIEELIEDQVGGYVDKMLNERLLSVLSTKENVNLATLGFAEENVKKYQAIITPIDIAGERLGTLFIYKSDSQYDIDDIILSEYGTTVVGLEMMRSVNDMACFRFRMNRFPNPLTIWYPIMAFSQRDASRLIPSLMRSWGTYPMWRSLCSRQPRWVMSLPSKATSPWLHFLSPNRPSTSSCWPEPATPAIPSISPFLISNETSFNFSRPSWSGTHRCLT